SSRARAAAAAIARGPALAPPASPPDAAPGPQPIPFYTNPSARNAVETALLIGRRLDTQG
ncbi:MAG: hypothetical protein C0468_07305, partial [Planctomyces sp.]|nr:hypothetical protein [Planctomyces sp.]